jgi:hypothetical protein
MWDEELERYDTDSRIHGVHRKLLLFAHESLVV